MPIIITFDQEGAGSNDLNRIHSMFLRFGWQSLGGSTFRYPRIHRPTELEDWLNHVVPALMMLRAYFTSTGRPLLRFTLDAHASVALDAQVATEGMPSNEQGILIDSSKPEFGKGQLIKWLEEIRYPYRSTERS